MSTLDLNGKLNVLVFGSGAREQAIAEAVLRSHNIGKLFLADAGFAKLGEIIEFTDFEDLALKCVEKEIKIAIIGPEEPLCEGIVDVLKKHNIGCIGVNKKFAQLEGSKQYAKKFMKKYFIKTAGYTVVTAKTLPDYNKLSYPIVIKADGLCQGKGVVIANNAACAKKTITEFLGGKFGENSKTILLEEFLKGEELSLMSLWDGKTLLTFAPCRDFKRLNKSQTSPNTGGMGAFCPVKMSSLQKEKLADYKTQLEKALIEEKADFCGFIYSGLVWVKKENSWNWRVLEYNVRLGDPEAQVTLAQLSSDFLDILKSALKQNLDKVKPEYNEGYSACLVLATEGYPKEPKDGQNIYVPDSKDIKVFYSGVTKGAEGQILSKGGRVLSLCTTDQKPFPILKEFAQRIKMEHKYFRQDIEIE